MSHGVAFLVLELCTGLLEGFRDFVGDFLGGDRAVGAVDLGKSLTFWIARCLGSVLVTSASAPGQERWTCVCGGEFLVGAENSTAPLSSVQSRLALDRLLALRASGTADLGSDASDAVPLLVSHFVGMWLFWRVEVGA